MSLLLVVLAVVRGVHARRAVGVVGDLDLAQITFLAVDVVGAGAHITKDTAVFHLDSPPCGAVVPPCTESMPGSRRDNHTGAKNMPPPYWRGHVWLGRRGSNSRMAESKSAALPLGYGPAKGGAGRRKPKKKDRAAF